MDSAKFAHTPVLLKETLSFLPDKAEILVDLTLGGAGHASALLEKNPDLFLYGADRDKEALAFAKKKLSVFADRIALLHNSFSEAVKRLIGKGVKADFILADLGVSSHQLDSSRRGFSFHQNGPLDMRMNADDPLNAADIVNTFSRKELAGIIKNYGEERFARRIADKIAFLRNKKPFSTTMELAECVKLAIPHKYRFGRLHPATKTFQAIRIALNRELEELDDLLKRALELLNPGGRIAVISFHSLEDRRVKKAFQSWRSPCQCPKNIPYCVCGLKPEAEIPNNGVIRASDREKEVNPRSRSAKLRVAEKI